MLTDLFHGRLAWIQKIDHRESPPRTELELLEPMVRVELEVPSEFQGGVVGNLSRKRTSLSSSQDMNGTCRIEAQVPLAEMLDYANEIRSLTQGKGTFTMTPSGYEATPKRIADLVTKSEVHRNMNIG